MPTQRFALVKRMAVAGIICTSSIIELGASDADEARKLYEAVNVIPQQRDQSAAALATAAAKATQLLRFAQPRDVKAEEWTIMRAGALKALGWVAGAQHVLPAAEAYFTQSLTLNDQDLETSALLATALYKQIKENRERNVPLSIYHWCRASAYEGPGALPVGRRIAINDFLREMYKVQYGYDLSPLLTVINIAKTQALPPVGFQINGALRPRMSTSRSAVP